MSELLDPGVVAAGVCGPSGKHATTFKPMQLALVSPAEAVADDPAGPPLWEGLGTLSYPITTDSEMAQRYFDQGLRLTYAFNHAEAYRAFKKAQELDPGCAMCFWGEAFVLGANINAPMEGSAVQPAFVAMTNAKARAAKASEPRAGADRRSREPGTRAIPRPTRRRSPAPTPMPWRRRTPATPTIRRSRCCSPTR